MTLHTFFKENPKVAIAFSGGTDSSYLLYSAKQEGCDIHAFFIKTAFQPQFELDDAMHLANILKVPLTVIKHDIFAHSQVTNNPSNRCYHCKNALFSLLKQEALVAGYALLIDGTNASDDCNDRPGMKALQELGVRSPLKECGITKTEVRALSKKAGLFTYDKPSYACLATRVPYGTPITENQLKKVEQAENTLFSMGFSNFRVRIVGSSAKLQLPASQFEKAVQCHKEILNKLNTLFSEVYLDLTPRAE